MEESAKKYIDGLYTETDIDGLQRQISMVYRDRYRWPRETDIDGLETDIDGLQRNISMACIQRQISMAYRDRYRWSRETDIDGLERQISIA